MDARAEVLDLPLRAPRWTWQAWLAMLLLITQSTALSIVLRLSRVKQGTPYLASVSGKEKNNCMPGKRWAENCVFLFVLTQCGASDSWDES